MLDKNNLFRIEASLIILLRARLSGPFFSTATEKEQ